MLPVFNSAIIAIYCCSICPYLFFHESSVCGTYTSQQLAPTILAVNCTLQSCARNNQVQIALPLLDKVMTHIKLQSLSHTTVLLLIQACAGAGLTVEVTKLVSFCNMHIYVSTANTTIPSGHLSIVIITTDYMYSFNMVHFANV
jgi:hypothetical protein